MAPPHEPHGRAVSGSERLYRALLAAYPKEFRRAYGREMAQVFRCMCREEVVSSGSRGLVRLWVRTLWDLLTTALAERIKQALGISTRMRSPSTLVRWSGLATPPRHTRGGSVHDEMDDPAPLERTDDRD